MAWRSLYGVWLHEQPQVAHQGCIVITHHHHPPVVGERALRSCLRAGVWLLVADCGICCLTKFMHRLRAIGMSCPATRWGMTSVCLHPFVQ